MTTVTLSPSSIEDYKLFLRIKNLPVYSFRGREAWFPDEYAGRLGVKTQYHKPVQYAPSPFCFDYQRSIAAMALRRRKFAIFAKPGRGKTIMYFEWLRTIMPRLAAANLGAAIISPPMIVEQTREEFARWYPQLDPIERVPSGEFSGWLRSCSGKIGITNYEAFRNEIHRGQLGALCLDESHALASHYGKYAQGVLALGRGLEWKLAGTGTPAPNDRIEYANHSVFVDHFPTVNSFLSRFFVNRGQTNERWVLKAHAVEAFYKALSAWSIFLDNPAVYGWKDQCDALPPINVHIHDVEMTAEQNSEVRRQTGQLFAARVGGIVKRSVLSRIAKGLDGTPTLKYEFIKSLVDSWPGKSTIIWCWFNEEQDRVSAMFPGAASIQGTTKLSKRLELIKDFQAGRIRTLISKPGVLGYGLNLQIARHHVFSSLIDSYRDYAQAIARSNRIGSTESLDVHIPIMDCERPMVETVLRKVKMVENDTRVQEAIFRAAREGKSVMPVIEREGIDIETFTED